MGRFNSIIGKNLKIFTRSKISALMVFIIPIIIVFLVGTAFNSESLTGIKIGTYSQQYNELTESIVSSLEEEGFSSKRYEQEEICINAVKLGEVHICIVFPSELKVGEDKGSIIYHVDNSRVNIAYSLINTVNSKISQKAQDLGLVIAQQLIDVLSQTSKTLADQENNVDGSIKTTSEIESNTNSLEDGLPDLTDLINKLESAKQSISKINDSSTLSAEKKIQETIDSLNISYSSINDNSKQISQKNSEVKNNLQKLSGELTKVIEDLKIVQNTKAGNVVSPIESEVGLIHKDGTNWEYIFPTLVALMALFSGIILASNLVLAEKNSRAHFRNFMTPTSDFTFIFGICVTGLIILLAQFIILFTGTAFITHYPFIDILSSVAFILLVSSPAFIFLGMFIGYTFKSEETVMLTSLSLAFLLMFFSNTILPTETISGNFKYIAQYSPLVITDSVLKKMIFFHSPIQTFYHEILILLGELIVFLGFAYLARKATKRFV